MKKILLITLTFMVFNINTQAQTKPLITERSFGNIGFELSRINTNETDWTKIPTEWAKTYGSDSYASLHIDRKVAEIARLRVAQLDNCNYCVIFHTKAALETGLEAPKVYAVSAWRDSKLFTEKEKAALQYAEALSQLDQDKIQSSFEQLSKVGFSNVEKEELSMSIILMSVWSRVFMAQGKTSVEK
ncbi:carboxymuconolactone decarboxylase family protein [Echinicola soli]|uniref:Carboxymuconolactone decarboxylase family protein n=1 Tax=Echinicola soli TaxID=2591634 RepID=A0A514CFD6_9BACT|nr:carboxymuconolactone decarboxylase family protein [Echinicola soli]QDH78547.1 carboxymuconolactone decarboxylase family protein [Echinicola soli]